jgi:L-malate glycosyltransferase
MRVLYFTRDYTPHDHRFLAALAQTSHTVGLLRLERANLQREDRPLPEHIEQLHWRGGKHPYRQVDLPMLLLDLRRVVHDFKPDVVHAGPVQSAAFLAALAGVAPLVTMSWGSDLLRDADRSRWMGALTRFTLQRTTWLVGDCQAVMDKAAGFGYPLERTSLFPWGVDLERFTLDGAGPYRARAGWDQPANGRKPFVILSLRAWEPLYGVDVVVKAFAMAAQECPELRLMLLGSGSQAGLVQSLLLRNQLHDRVLLGGQVNNDTLPDYYHSADLYVSASHSDGSSVSLMEALASGLPALVSDIPGNREWIIPGREGWLFPDGDENALAESMIAACRQRREMGKMRVAARTLAERRANWKNNFQVLLQAYEQAVETDRSGRK